MKKQLTAKFIMFTVGLLWVMLFLYTCIFSFDFWQDMLVHYAELEDGWFFTVMEVFYLLTCLGIGIFAAARVFRFVGQWESKEEQDTRELIIDEKDTDAD